MQMRVVLFALIMIGSTGSCARSGYPGISEMTPTDYQRLIDRASGDAEAAFLLGMYNLISVDDRAEGLKWLKLAADNGHLTAQLNLAFELSAKGDKELAMRYLAMAAGSGDPVALRRLAHMLVQENDIGSDPVSARRLLARAGKAGNVGALIELAEMQRTGTGGVADATAARESLDTAKRLVSKDSELMAEIQAKIESLTVQ